MTDEKLEPCPFCEADMIALPHHDFKHPLDLTSDQPCALNGRKFAHEDRAAWNTRPPNLSAAAALRMAAEQADELRQHYAKTGDLANWALAEAVRKDILSLTPETDQAALATRDKAVEAALIEYLATDLEKSSRCHMHPDSGTALYLREKARAFRNLITPDRRTALEERERAAKEVLVDAEMRVRCLHASGHKDGRFKDEVLRLFGSLIEARGSGKGRQVGARDGVET